MFSKKPSQVAPEQPSKKVVFPPKKPIENAFTPREISEQLIKKILYLEQFFHNKGLNIESTNDLVSAYVQAVEYFDRMQPSMRIYFLEKIQFVLSRPQVINILSGTEPNKTRDTLNNFRDTLRGTMMTMSRGPVMENPVFSKKEVYNKDKHLDYDEDRKKKERSLKAQMYVDVQQEIKEQAPQLRAEYHKLEKTEQDVIKMINNQADELEKRRAMRKNKKKRNSLDKQKVEEIQETQPIIQPEELKQMQKEVHDDIIRFTIRQTFKDQQRVMPSSPDRQPATNGGDSPQQHRQTKGGGRIKIQQDDDDD